MTDTRNDRIRERAHQIWEQAGSPDGKDMEHWQQAEREIDAEDAAVPMDTSGPALLKRKGRDGER